MPQSSHGPTATYSFNSFSGQELARQLLKPKVPFDLHDYQIEGTCAALHGQDLLGCIPTGGGKTAFLFLPILLIHALHNDASLPAHFKKRYPRYPVMITVFPTNSLELEKEKEFEAVGVRALAINAQKLDEARKTGKNLWHDARNGVSIILLSPEQLISRAFEDLIQDPAFSARIFFIGVDEIQLLDIWGASFRKAFQQIGFIRARLPERIVLIALTATLLAGERHANICRFLGLKTGHYHLIRRSNTRPDIQLLVRVLTAGLGGWNFPDLDWVLERNRKTIIFCKTILLGFRVMVYLWLRAPSFPDRATRIRSYNSLNSVTYNARTQELMLTPRSGLQIIVATDTLSQGVNAPDIHDVITMGQPTDPDEFFQRIGRAGRDRTAVTDARGMMYVPASAHKTAREVLGLADGNPSRREKKLPEMHDGVARLLLAPCLRKEQDLLYDNPSSDPPCTCPSCASHPPLSCSIPCNCSGCVVDPGDTKPKLVNFFIEDPASMFVTRPRRLKVHEIKVTRQRLIEHRWTVWEAADEVEAALEPPELYLPDETITVLLEHFSALDGPSNLDSLLQLNPYAQKGRDRLWATICDIRQSLQQSDAACPEVDVGTSVVNDESSTHDSSTVSGVQYSPETGSRAADALSVTSFTSRPQSHTDPLVTVEIPDRPDIESGRSGIVIRIRRPRTVHETVPPLSPSKRKRNAQRATDSSIEPGPSAEPINKRKRVSYVHVVIDFSCS